MDINPVTLLTGVAATKSSMLAALAFLLYDHAITFDAERAFVWKHRWSFGKMLFVFNRYFGLCALLSYVIVWFCESLTDEFCNAFFRWQAIIGTSVCLSAEIILQARIYAVYSRNKKLLVIMVSLCVAETVATTIFDFVWMPKAMGIPGLTGCYARSLSPKYFLVWVPALTFETILCILMLNQAWRLYQEQHSLPLLNLIIRDSVLYFLTIFGALFVNCLIWILGSETIVEIALGWEVAIPCALGSRLLLNMRQRYLTEQTALTLNPQSQTGADMHFGTPGSETVGTGRNISMKLAVMSALSVGSDADIESDTMS